MVVGGHCQQSEKYRVAAQKACYLYVKKGQSSYIHILHHELKKN